MCGNWVGRIRRGNAILTTIVEGMIKWKRRRWKRRLKILVKNWNFRTERWPWTDTDKTAVVSVISNLRRVILWEKIEFFEVFLKHVSSLKLKRHKKTILSTRSKQHNMNDNFKKIGSFHPSRPAFRLFNELTWNI